MIRKFLALYVCARFETKKKRTNLRFRPQAREGSIIFLQFDIHKQQTKDMLKFTPINTYHIYPLKFTYCTSIPVTDYWSQVSC